MRKLNVFAHTPKCAGTSITKSIIDSIGRSNVQLDHDRLFEPTTLFNMDPDGFLKKAKAEITARPPTARFIMGHLYIRKYEDVADCFRFTFLRHPIDRLISNYYFWKEPGAEPTRKHHLFDYVRNEQLSLQEFARLPFMRWFYTRMFFRDVDMRSFDFIGFQEDFEADIRKLSEALELPLKVTKENSGSYEGDAALRESTRTDSVISELQSLLEDDIVFYQKLFEKHKSPVLDRIGGAAQPKPSNIGAAPSKYYYQPAMQATVENNTYRSVIGGLWEELGQLQLEYLQSQGLRPTNRLLDIGCGTLRLGVRAVDFLDAGNYFGTDLNLAFLDAGYEREIIPAGLDSKLPRSNLVVDGEFTFAGLPKQFDFAIAQSVFTHLPVSHLRLCLTRLADHLEGPCSFFFTVFIAPAGQEKEPIEQFPGIVSYPDKDPYHYTLEDLQNASAGLPWQLEFVGDWKHPRNQMMVCARLQKDDFSSVGQSLDGKAGTREISAHEARSLPPGAQHYTAYVGPPSQWDFMGATQFRLLTALGLRQHHKVLDLGCGSLRAGRFLIVYLAGGNYFGLEPNTWLIDDAIERELGDTLIKIKQPTFSSNSNFDVGRFGAKFDFIVAQSIFSHAGPDLVNLAFRQFRAVLQPGGLALVTFIHPEKMPDVPMEAPGWTYPGCTTYEPHRIQELIAAAGLAGRALPWFHPRQTWYVLALRPEDLPPADGDKHLSGAVLRDPEFAASR
jgi:SAM-dependent methyltransferase